MLKFHITAPWQEYGEYTDANDFERKIGWYRRIWLFIRYPKRGWVLAIVKRPVK